MKKNSHICFVIMAMAFATLSCSIFSRAVNRDMPVEAARTNVIRQWAKSAYASSEYGSPDWSAKQATGAPDTLECGDQPTAWAPYDNFTVEWLEVQYDTLVTPTEINIYESHTPTQVVRVEVVDTGGIYHEVYTAEPKIMDCPYILSIPVTDANYQVAGVKITIDQSQLNLPWDEIDAVELVGYGQAGITEGPAIQTQDVQSAPPEEPQLPSLSQAPESNGGATEKLSGQWTTYNTANGLAHEEVHAVALAYDGTLWVASGPFGKQSLSNFKNDAFTTYELEKVSLTHHGLTIGADGTVWAATGTRLDYFDGQSWKSYTKQDGMLDDATKSVGAAPDGSLWVGSVKGVSHFKGGIWTKYTKDDGLVDTFIEAVAIDANGNPWFISSFNGISYFNGGKWTSYYKGDELPNATHTNAAIGPDGSVWIGSGGGGVSRFDGNTWTNYTVGDGYELEYVKAIVQAADGAMWFSTEGNGVFRFDGQGWMNFRKEDGLCYDYVDSIAAASDGSMWFGCRKNGIAHFEP